MGDLVGMGFLGGTCGHCEVSSDAQRVGLPRADCMRSCSSDRHVQAVTRTFARKPGELFSALVVLSSSTLTSSCSFNGFTRQGTFSEYAVANADNVIPIPESITPEQACPILCVPSSLRGFTLSAGS